MVVATALQLTGVSAALVLPSASAGFSHVHFHHWLMGVLGASAFHFQRRFGMAAQVITAPNITLLDFLLRDSYNFRVVIRESSY